MELWQLKTFRAVAENLNFTKASEQLFLTQSAVSHQIKALEAEFGVPLFIRGKRGVLLTDAGQTALRYAIKILDEAEEMRQFVAGRERALAGRVRVAAATQALVYLFAPLFEDFMDTHESVELVFRTTVSTEQTVEDILNGVADVGFASLAVYSPNLEVAELFEDELVLLAGKKHKLAQKEEVSVRQLERERWILFERGSSIRRATDDFFKRENIEPETALESNDTYFIKIMIEHGLGVSLLPAWAVREEIERGDLTLVKVKNLNIKRTVAILSMKGQQSAPIRAFIKYVTEKKEDLQKLAKI
jgi:DNA-binding transcriptional LysR family regulator